MVINRHRQHQLYNALVLQCFKGTRAAALYMKSLGWSIEATMYHLLGKDV